MLGVQQAAKSSFNVGVRVNWDASPVSFPSHTGVLCLLLMYCMRNDYVVTND